MVLLTSAIAVGQQATPAAPTSEPTSQPTSQPASRPAVPARPREVQLFIEEALLNTKVLNEKRPQELKEAQIELAAAKTGPILQNAKGHADVERVLNNGKVVFRYTNPEVKRKTYTELQSKVDAMKKELAEIQTGKLFIPAIDFGSPAVERAGTTDARRAKVVKIMGPDQAIMGFGANRYWVYGVNTKDWIEGGPESFPEWVAITGKSSYLDLMEGEMKPVFVMKAVKKFDLEAEAEKVKAEKAAETKK